MATTLQTTLAAATDSSRIKCQRGKSKKTSNVLEPMCNEKRNGGQGSSDHRRNAQQPVNGAPFANAFNFQSLVKAAARSAVREALNGARRLQQDRLRSSSPVITIDVEPNSVSACLVSLYDPATAAQQSVDAWSKKVDGLSAASVSSDKRPAWHL